MIKRLYLIILAVLPIMCSAREVTSFNSGWKFSLESDVQPGVSDPEFNDRSWRQLDLPHDWAIEGDFSQDNPSGPGGGALPGGVGWYRKQFRIRNLDCRYKIEFDGIYMNSSVYVNGHLVGTRPYGYISFSYDITDFLVRGSNTIAVRVDNSDQPNSRWYSGCGIYRDVRLVKVTPVHVAQWGTYVTARTDNNRATLDIETRIENDGDAGQSFSVWSTVLDSKGRIVASRSTRCDSTVVRQTFDVQNPHLWDIEDPHLYTLRTEIRKDGRTIDSYSSTFGIRDIRFDAATGFYLNGKHVVINGVCLHHDQGCLGTAVNRRAIERQLQILKDMGCNAIRCSHNPPSPVLLDLCDSMGFLVMDEAFDMWHKKKTGQDYARFFDDWAERDLTDMILRDRNHPSIVIWSIGNEVQEQWDYSLGMEIAPRLAGLIRSLDPTRPITAGCNEPGVRNPLFQSGALDIIGFNYHNSNVESVPRLFPGKPFIVTESVSALMTRGYYEMPSDEQSVRPERWDKPYYNESFACSAYDNVCTPWGSHHEENLLFLKRLPFVAGQFVWTGFDYIGEPTPYGWPARSSYFGIIDLAGFPKDIYYLYQSEWTDKTVLHLFPHWNWKPGQEVDMCCYFNNADEVELFVNGQSEGIAQKDSTHASVHWKVKYRPGTVKAVARKDGRQIAVQEIHTAGEPAMIRLTADRRKIKSDGRDLSFVTVEILDKDGNLCPQADNLVEFKVRGAAFIAGVDNGSPISLERFRDSRRKAMNGKCLVVLQNNGRDGRIKLTASSGLLKTDAVTLDADMNY
mgnify:CR=1 FL=1